MKTGARPGAEAFTAVSPLYPRSVYATDMSISLSLPASLDNIVITAELEHRPARTPDFQGESQALVGLMKGLKESNANVLQALAETALRLCRAHSAGIGILEEEGGQEIFRWHGAAGQWSAFLMGTMPREVSPFGTVDAVDLPLGAVARHPVNSLAAASRTDA
jgi:hypothetical protein